MSNYEIEKKAFWMHGVLSPLSGTIVLMAIILLVSCGRDDIYEGNDINIETSIDTLLFDTVFTEIGSVTRSFKLYNDLDKAVSINVTLANGENSVFRINADGVSGIDIHDVIVQAQDSAYVFVEVTINPDEPLSTSPYIVEDDIIITGGNMENQVHLEAFGQNANYIIGKDITTIGDLCATGNIVWDDPKPYVVYGILAISGCELTLPAGTDVYVHGGLVIDRVDTITYNAGRIITLNGGSIKSLGTAANPVTFQSDRLEMEYQDIPGQWFGILLSKGSAPSSFDHTIIKDAIYSMYIDSVSQVDINSVQMLNSLSVGLFASQSKTTVTNSLIYSAGSYGIYYHFGGEHHISYTTAASYLNQTEAIRMQNYFCTDPLCLGEIKTNPLIARIDNSILVGGSRDEVLLDEFDGGDLINLDYQINNSIVRVDELLESRPNFFDNCENCINYNGSDTLFVNVNENNFELDSLSIAEKKAQPISNITTDILGRVRGVNPDIGCYESQFK